MKRPARLGLAGYLQWHARQRLKPLLAGDGEGKERQWTFARVVERLKDLRSKPVSSAGVEFYMTAQAQADQQVILDLLSGKEEAAANLK